MAVRIKDISGIRFGSLTAVEYSHSNKNGLAFWVYRCVCGKEHTARANTVTYDSQRKGDPELPSCGCVELKRKTKHGFRKVKNTHPAYRAYRGMMSRCYNPNDQGYEWYGAVGVGVCDQWKDNPEAFVQWSIENGWAKGLHIDKDILCKAKGICPHIYSPETCQWVPAKTNVGAATNRTNYGKHPNVRLSQEEVDELLHKYFSGEQTNQSELARQYGLKNPSSVGRLIKLERERRNAPL